MVRRRIEPGLLRIFRMFSGLEAIAFFILVGLIETLSGDLNTRPNSHYVINMIVALVLFFYLSIPWLQYKLRQFYLPLALLAATVTPILSNRLYLQLALEQAPIALSNAWELIPLLFVPLVLIAWQYDLQAVALFCIGTGIFDFFLTTALAVSLQLDIFNLLGIIFLRTISLAAAGFMVTQLMGTQREQRHKLQSANLKLSQYADTLEQLAVSRERNRLARELHDTVAHTLSGLAVQLEAMHTVIRPRNQEAHTMLNLARATTRVGLTETRRALKDLRASPLEDLGLKLALCNMAQSVADRGGMSVNLDLHDNLDHLPSDVEQGIYRIAQETLENILRHAEATSFEMILSNHSGLLHFLIHDNGCGFNIDAPASEDGLGLKGIHERATMIGGKLKITSSAAAGTNVLLILEDTYD